MLKETHKVCFPYGFTLLSNSGHSIFTSKIVCFSYEFTLLSNIKVKVTRGRKVYFPYEFTLLSNIIHALRSVFLFVSPTNLHCSQTPWLCSTLGMSLFPLRIYTALKLPCRLRQFKFCLFPLRIYTALKLIY